MADLAYCPDCGQLISLRFPLHACPKAPAGSPNHVEERTPVTVSQRELDAISDRSEAATQRERDKIVERLEVVGRPKRQKPKSRPQRWSDAVSTAQAALQGLTDALQELYDVQQEYVEWRDNLPENLQGSALGEKLETIADLDLDPGSLLSEVESVLGEAEGADLPLGFGRD